MVRALLEPLKPNIIHIVSPLPTIKHLDNRSIKFHLSKKLKTKFLTKGIKNILTPLCSIL